MNDASQPSAPPPPWRLTWVAGPSFRPSYGVRIDASRPAPGGWIWIVPALDEPAWGWEEGLHLSAARLFKKAQRAPLPADLRATLTGLILRVRIGLGPQEDLGCDGTTHELSLRVGSHHLEVGWWNEPEGHLEGLQPLANILEGLVTLG